MPRKKKLPPLYHVNISVAGLRAGQTLELSGDTIGGVSIDGLLSRGFLTIIAGEDPSPKESNDDSTEQGRDDHPDSESGPDPASEPNWWPVEDHAEAGFGDFDTTG